ncbi:MAG: hypothetical protein B7X37_03145 [Halothiobacillus sp. 14-55-98]|jgi:hypothetical protein|nr:MAG: hypothetical protein B7X37_03145 [Halothiobacillus sp. 14-55-98]
MHEGIKPNILWEVQKIPSLGIFDDVRANLKDFKLLRCLLSLTIVLNWANIRAFDCVGLGSTFILSSYFYSRPQV